MKPIGKVSLFYLANPRFGGWVTYTTHLFRSFKEIGYQVALYKITKRTEKSQRHYADGIYYQNIDIDLGNYLCTRCPAIITATDKAHANETETLLKNKAQIIIHDPTEMREGLVTILKENGCKPITIREVNVANLKQLSLESTYIRHPYIRFNKTTPDKTNLAVSTSRIDFDKHTEMIVEANQTLTERVKIYGAENRLYTFHKLAKKYPQWRKDYCGRFSNDFGSVFRILNPSKFMLDMSAIKRDGGGSQYTFLEGWDASCVLILNKKWDLGSASDMKGNVNCLYADNPKELCDILQSEYCYKDMIGKGLEDLKMYEGGEVAKEYMQVMGEG